MRTAPRTTPDQYPAPAPLTPEEQAALPHDNAGPKLNASIWALAGIATVFLALRIYCRAFKRQSFWWDDAILIAAWVCTIIQSALLTHITTLGYGLHIWDYDFSNMEHMMLPTSVAGTLSIVAAVWSKTSFGITLLKITDGWIKKLTWYCIISMNIAMGLSGLFPWVSCTPIRKVWDLYAEGTCWDPRITTYYNIFSAAYSALMDITLAFLPWKFLWGLQMKPREKIGVGIAMSMGVFAGITAIIKTSMLPRMLLTDFAEGVDLWILGNAEICSSIIAACIPMLRVLVREAKSLDQCPSGYANETYVTENYSRFVSVTGRPGPKATPEVELQKIDDEGSDRSILGSSGGAPQPKNAIVQMTGFAVQYDAASDTGETSNNEERTG
ncbi:hypothetical protein MMYC01_206366 [Madurella mycetomatis]|uniref:Rhodopsin domain-containing protein n=1 Tax=Madurella mycetomatis TaxID=100816 RepID=A0A175W496_9PEZI|nr:hypothetical protein MMYC01_206366 [Madurella mycetomatis]